MSFPLGLNFSSSGVSSFDIEGLRTSSICDWTQIFKPIPLTLSSLICKLKESLQNYIYGPTIGADSNLFIWFIIQSDYSHFVYTINTFNIIQHLPISIF